MISRLRSRFWNFVLLIVIALITVVFVFWGIFTPPDSYFSGGGNVASVNGEPVTSKELQEEVKRMQQMYRNFNIGEDQLKQFIRPESLLESLIDGKLQVQAAEELGFAPGKAAIQDQILRIPVFQKDGKFDMGQYRAYLRYDQTNDRAFQRKISEYLVRQMWNRYFEALSLISEAEIQEQFLQQNNKRDVKYVQLSKQEIRKFVEVPDRKWKRFIEDPAQLSLAKGRYEIAKETTYKGKTFDQVKEQIARESIAEQDKDGIEKLSKELADRIAQDLKAGVSPSLDAYLKKYGLKVQDAKAITLSQPYIPGIGEAQAIVDDAFAEPSSIDASQGGKAKVYDLVTGKTVALVVKAEKPDLAKLTGEEKKKLKDQLENARRSELMRGWMAGLRARAKISKSAEVAQMFN